MEYRGYVADYEYDEQDGTYFGWVDGIRSMVTFEAPSLAELEREFRISVDAYLELCAERELAVEASAPSAGSRPSEAP
jgi:predicted HicB family RNase H-like nuclease